MDERITFIAAAVTAELMTSVIFYLGFPESPATAGDPDILSYVGHHASMIVVAWTIILVAAWFALGQPLIRLRQNTSSKMKILLWSSLTGVALDNATTLYQISVGPEAVRSHTNSIASGLAIRTVFYVVTFALVVMVFYVVAGKRKPSMTPPPRFGREQ